MSNSSITALAGLEQVLYHLRNWFELEIHTGPFTIANGQLVQDFLRDGQYYRIVGSIFADGLHKCGASEQLTDETFTGAVWALSVPKAVVDLAAEISAWNENNKAAVESPYISESFGGYSYTKAGGTGSSGAAGGGVTWQSMFRARLSPWRKI